MKKTAPYLAILGAVLLSFGCSTPTETAPEPLAPVQLTAVTRASIQRVIEADGVLRALDQSAVMSKISAPVSKFYVNRGDHVRKGELLASLESRDLAAAVVDAKGAYDQALAAYRTTSGATVPDEVVKAQADVQATREALDAARKLRDSRQQLFREGALAQRLVDEASVAYVQAKSAFDTAQKHLESVHGVFAGEAVKGAAGQLESAKGKYQAAEAQLAYAEIRSPISGVVADRAIYPGEMAAAGSALLTVMDISSIIARVNIPQSEAVFVKVGQSAQLAAGNGAVQTQGKVTVVSPALDPQSTTLEIWVQASNPGERFRPGGTVHVTLQAGIVPDAVVVPQEAILPGQAGGKVVMTVGADSIAHARKVQTGIENSGQVQILSGVEPGAMVIVSGGVGLDDGTKVHVEAAGAKAGQHE
ncbi:MAG: efflux RND transporter periplasmic adaptor subunit [Bryobacteraceae bacterium]